MTSQPQETAFEQAMKDEKKAYFRKLNTPQTKYSNKWCAKKLDTLTELWMNKEKTAAIRLLQTLLKEAGEQK